MDTQPKFIEQVVTLVQERAANDPEFRARCLTSPDEALKSMTGINIPEQLKVTFAEDEQGRLNLVLPPEAFSEGLSDEDLDAVAGGSDRSSLGPCPFKMVGHPCHRYVECRAFNQRFCRIRR